MGVSLFYTWAYASLLVCIDFSVRLATFLAVDLVGIFLVSFVFFFCCPLDPDVPCGFYADLLEGWRI
ncbi:MAG: hypothetical protein JWM04_2599 [Verrucomicrobiales bacterium]|nr:hypothetical protein [Verrucomicrobiales bacterium]